MSDEFQSSAAERAKPRRLPKLEGIDYKGAAIDYPNQLDAERAFYLRTKPFYHLGNKPPKYHGRGLDVETHRYFCDFANIAVALELPAGSRILDVACGSGWISEYLARLGYDVTGTDISPELIRISEERLRSIDYGADHQTPLRCRFLVHDIESTPLPEKFDAIICYDAMHHFVDEHAVARHFAAMLEIGGTLFVLEGNRPPANSPAEQELIGVMQRYRTLESPFDPAYLCEVLDVAGFRVVGDYVSVNTLIDREMVDADGRVPVEVPAVNYLLCKKICDDAPASSAPDSRTPGVLHAELRALSDWPTEFSPAATWTLRVSVRNCGDTLWLGGRYLRRGAVMLGIKILSSDGGIIDEFHGDPPLPRAMLPNEQLELVIEHACPTRPGSYTLKIDLVDQHICWFEERGSEVLVLPMSVR